MIPILTWPTRKKRLTENLLWGTSFKGSVEWLRSKSHPESHSCPTFQKAPMGSRMLSEFHEKKSRWPSSAPKPLQSVAYLLAISYGKNSSSRWSYVLWHVTRPIPLINLAEPMPVWRVWRHTCIQPPKLTANPYKCPPKGTRKYGTWP